MKGHWIVQFEERDRTEVAVGPFFSEAAARRWSEARDVNGVVVPVTPAWDYSPKEGS